MKKYFITFLLSILSICFFIYLIIKMDSSSVFTDFTGLYLFSALIQANAAIFSIIGVFYIFRLQSIQSSISNIFNALYNENIGIRQHAEEFNHKDIDGKRAYSEKLTGDDPISKNYRDWLEYELEKNDLRDKIRNPLFTIVILIIIQIVFLIISNGIHSLGNWFEIISYLLIGLFQIYVLIIVVNSIISIINRKNV